MGLITYLKVRHRFFYARETYVVNSRRPYSFGVPKGWYSRQLRYLKRLKNLLSGKKPFEAI